MVGPAGPRLLERRTATPLEEEHLAAAAEALLERLTAAGLDARLVPGHLNRRSIDLVPDWTAPPGAELPDLQRRVDERLRAAGFDGLHGVIELARELARDAGLAHPAVGSDARHVDMGLTGKSDAMRAVLRGLVLGRNRRPQDLLVLGDTFGAVADGQGTDSAMLIPELRRTVYVSVGAEPAGAPPQVLHHGGGPIAFLDILHDQLAMREIVAVQSFPQPTTDPAWRFEVKGFDPFREREAETWLTVANGETGTRGALEEGSAISHAGDLRRRRVRRRHRRPGLSPAGAGARLDRAAPAWSPAAPSRCPTARSSTTSACWTCATAWCSATWRQRLRSGRTVRVRTARFASLADRQIMAARAEAVPEDFSGSLVWQSAIGVTHAGGPTRETEFEVITDPPGLVASTRGRNGGGHALAVTTNPAPGSPVARTPQQARDVIGGRLEPGDPATVDRLAAIVSARTKVPSAEVARRALERARDAGYDELLRRHRAAWEAAWAAADVRVDGDADDQHALRFAIYHMISTAHPTKDTVSIGARGLGGMSYFLHVFWDTEIFVLPFFIYTQPETALTLLTYRYRNLPGAREKAAHMGFNGRALPLGVGGQGRRDHAAVRLRPRRGEGPHPLRPHGTPHLGGRGLGGLGVLEGDRRRRVHGRHGRGDLLETARFWASRAARDDEGSYHIRVVVGPDEYHEGVDDNAYTNVLARWNIKRALEALAWLKEVDADYAETLHRTAGALRHGAVGLAQGHGTATRRGSTRETLLYEQFAGFYDMDDVPIEKLRPRPDGRRPAAGPRRDAREPRWSSRPTW